jgi:hypothetical protein
LHDNDFGPFCVHCADTRSALIHLYQRGELWLCKSCNNNPWFISQINREVRNRSQITNS